MDYYTTGQPDLVSIMKKNKTRFNKGYSLTNDIIKNDIDYYNKKRSGGYIENKDFVFEVKNIFDLAFLQLKRENKINIDDLINKKDKIRGLVILKIYDIINKAHKQGQGKKLNNFLASIK